MQTAGVSIYLHVVLFSEAVFKYIETCRECKRKQPLFVDIERHTSTLFYVCRCLKEKHGLNHMNTLGYIHVQCNSYCTHAHTHAHKHNVVNSTYIV